MPARFIDVPWGYTARASNTEVNLASYGFESCIGLIFSGTNTRGELFFSLTHADNLTDKENLIKNELSWLNSHGVIDSKINIVIVVNTSICGTGFALLSGNTNYSSVVQKLSLLKKRKIKNWQERLVLMDKNM